MRKGKVRPSEKAELRHQDAEQQKNAKEVRHSADRERRVHEETQRLVHELRVHQIELEVQNDELRAIQASIEESRSRYEDLYDFSPIGYFTFDGKGLIGAVNLTGAQLLGMERKALIRSPFSSFVASKSLKDFYAHLAVVFTSDTKQTCELWVKTRQESQTPVVMESIRIKGGQGGRGQCLSAIFDIASRKQAEEALRVSEERLNLALAASEMGVWEWNIEAGTIYWSPECLRILDVTGFGGRLADFTDALDPRDAARVRTAIDRALAEKSIFRKEFRIVRPGGEVRWLSNLGRVTCDETGKPLRMTGTTQDITERKVHAEALQRYELLASHSRDIILFMSRDNGRILEANAAASKAYGYSRAELLGLTIHDLSAAGTAGLTAAQMAKADAQGLLFETIHRCKDGKTCPMEVSTRGATIGETRTLISVIRDITKRKKAEEALREREELFRMTFDRSPIGAAMVGLDQRITRANAELCRMLGYGEEEIAGKSLRDITHPEDIGADLENFRTMVAGRIKSFAMEKRYVRKDGGIIWGRLSASLIRDAHGHPLYLVGLIEDITERRQSERHQHLAAEVLRILNDPSTLDDSIDQILAAIRREMGFDGVGIRLRKGEDFPYYRTLGLSADFVQAERDLCALDAEGKIIRDGQGIPELECMCGNILRGRTNAELPFFTEGGSFWSNCTTELLNSAKEQDLQARTRNRCNSEGYESVALIPLRSDDKVVGILQLVDRHCNRFTPGMIRFLEGLGASIGIAMMRRQMEKVLDERTRELENVNKDLESFSYSVTHDLRAPLRAIEGYSRMLLRRKGEQFDAETRRQFDLIRDNALSMNQLIDDMLAFSRLGRQEVAMSRIDIDGLVREIWEALCGINPDRRVSLKIDDLPPCMGDPALIRQVLTNLLSNAIKYTRGRDVALVEVGCHADENENAYYVKDNGAGFDMAYYGKLFGVFQRLHSPAEFEGTGVGLAIVQRIIQRHGGRVWAEAEVGKGARFHFTIPKSKD
jgi:PAS domain S-box-containing protein